VRTTSSSGWVPQREGTRQHPDAEQLRAFVPVPHVGSDDVQPVDHNMPGADPAAGKDLHLPHGGQPGQAQRAETVHVRVVEDGAA
jgi:hypothetical protein